MDMVNVKINGADYSVPAGVTVLEACRYANIDIPTLCYLKQINGRIYDITGDITEETIYSWVLWKTIYYQDPKLAARVMRDCMWKVPDGVILCEFCAHSFDDDWGNKICDIDNHPVTGNDTCGKAVKK